MKTLILSLLLCVGVIVPSSFSQCFIIAFNVIVSGCDPADNTFDLTGDLEFQDAPTTGQLILEDCNGNQQTFNAPFSSPLNFAITDIDSDGTSNCEIYAYFTDNTGCDITSAPFDYPTSCVCDVEVGTFTDSMSGVSTISNPYQLCFGDELHITGNGDFMPSQDFNMAGINYDPGVFLFIYSCPPTVSSTDDLNTDPCLAGIYSTDDQDWIIVNTLGDSSTYWFVPVSMYSMMDGIYAVSINGGDWCYERGPAYQVTFLEENRISNVSIDTSTCSGGAYTTSGQVDFSNPPATGQLIVSDCNGNQETFDPPFSSPTTYTITGQNCDGGNCSITAYFTVDSTVCNVNFPYTAPVSDTCNALILPVVNDTMCKTNGLVSLAALDTSGVWSADCGGCINSSGVFDPGAANTGENKIYHEVNNGMCIDKDTLSLYVFNCASLTEQQFDAIKIFPNPASAEVTIAADAQIESISVYGLQGKLHDQLNFDGTAQTTVKLDRYEDGIYLLAITTSRGTFVKKIVIRN